MDAESCGTPQKKSSIPISVLLPQKISLAAILTPIRAARQIHPRSPSAKQMSGAVCSSYANQVINTPPAKRFHKVKNPFEAALTERLHLPLIGSPSLFQCPTTPQFSSTQFEWTIEDVSSLKPAHVEPHETQFQDSPDPDYEAKAQMAISSYFKEQQIVPSPVDCPLRSQRIILSEMNGNTPISKPGRRIRECSTQTDLTFPSVLPKALEEALRPYFRMQLTEPNENESTPKDRKQARDSMCHGSYDDFKDTSLRRKLFDMHNIVILDSEKRMSVWNDEITLPNPSLIITDKNQNTAIIGKLSDSTDNSSIGSLSPISACDGLSVSSNSLSGSKGRPRLQNFLDFCETETLSPIHPSPKNVISCKSFEPSIMESKEKYRSVVNVSEHTFSDLLTCEKDLRDHSSSQFPSFPFEKAVGYTDSSFNIRVSRLVVNTSNVRSAEKVKKVKSRSEKSMYDMDIFMHEDTSDINYNDDEDLQMSRLSAQSSFCSSSNSDTPRGKRRNRSASRKNLSQSFSTNCFEDYTDENRAFLEKELQPVQSQTPKSNLTETFVQGESKILSADSITKSVSAEQRIFKRRTDSGFNEMTNQNTHNDYGIIQAAKQLDSDISMGCCSTPSKHLVEIF